MAKRLTIEDMHELASSKGGKCLSTKYTNNRTKLLWQCALGHTWQAAPCDIKQGCWCPYCALERRASKSRERRLTIEEMQQLASNKGGKCLSAKYTNSHTKLLWQCALGHIWQATSSDIKQGHWCPSCAMERRASKLRLTIEEMQQLASNKGGKCLSTQYQNNTTKLLWKCAFGHTWQGKPKDIKQGHWCPYCGGTVKLTIEKMREVAQARGGKCLSTKYINNRTKLWWQCKAGHTWEATQNNIKAGKWCPRCRRQNVNSRKAVHKKMRALNKSKHGK